MTRIVCVIIKTSIFINPYFTHLENDTHNSWQPIPLSINMICAKFFRYYNTAVKWLVLILQCSAHTAYFFRLFSEDIPPDRAQAKQARK